MELGRVVKNKKHQSPPQLGRVEVVNVNGVKKKTEKTLTFLSEMCTSSRMPSIQFELLTNLPIYQPTYQAPN